jgi:hypothetical protein
VALYDTISDLPLRIDDYALRRRERETPNFTRVTTVFELGGNGTTGRGEDVTYDAEDHDALLSWDGRFPLAGEYTFGEFSDALDDVNLFPTGDPASPTFRNYRRWGIESAALDLALRQAGTNLGGLLDREPGPVNFVASTRLGDPPTLDRVEALLAVQSDLGFKLDPTSAWTPDLIAALADRASVRVLDLKSFYEGTEVDQEVDQNLYRLAVEGFPGAVIEDPALTDATRPIIDGHEDRISWDYPITGVESVRSLPFEPSWLNVKPSRFGTVESLLDTVEYARQRNVRLYGGGQFELDVGRGQIQELAALFYPDGPNDVAPRGYNDPEPPDDLPASPLAPPDDHVGFGW